MLPCLQKGAPSHYNSLLHSPIVPLLTATSSMPLSSKMSMVLIFQQTFHLSIMIVYGSWDRSLEFVRVSESEPIVLDVDGTVGWDGAGPSWEASYRGGSLCDGASVSGLYGGGGRSNHGGRLASRTACEYEGGESRETPDGYSVPESSCRAWGVELYCPTEAPVPGDTPAAPGCMRSRITRRDRSRGW